MKSLKKRENIITAAIVLALLALAMALDILLPGYHIAIKVLKKGAVYALVAVSMNLLNGFTGLFSLGQAGFMLLGAYSYAVLCIPVAKRAGVYQYFDGGLVQFSLPEVLGKLPGMLAALLIGGLIAALLAFLIGLPVLRLKSDYLAIATLGFAEIIRSILQWGKLGPVTNGSNMLKSFTRISNFKIGTFSLSTFVPVLIAVVSIGLIVMLVNSTYGRAFKAIRDDEVAAEAMGINLAKHKMISFVVSSFFAGVSGATMAMVLSIAQANNYKVAMTYEILLMVVLGGIGSISGSVIGSLLFVATSEWWLRGLDSGKFLGISAPGVFRNGFRLVVFSIVIMVVVLFFRKGIMGDRELPQVIDGWRKKPRAKKTAKQEVASE